MSANPRTRKILAIDWDARTLRIVHAQLSKRGVSIDRLLSAAIPTDVDPSQPEALGRHIRQALDQEGIATRHAAVDIPRDQVILNTLTLPALLTEELPGMVQIQIAKELPYSVGDAVIDFAAAPREGDSPTTDVLVAAVRREVLEQYEATFAAAGLKLDRIGLRPYASKLSICELLKHGMPERVVFMDVGPNLTEIGVLRNSALAFCRAASVHIPPNLGAAPLLTLKLGDEEGKATRSGEQPPADMESVIQSLVVELTRSIEAYRGKDPGAQIDHVVIGGDLGVEESLADAIQKRLGVGTEIYNPGRSFGWEPDEGAAAAAFAATLGLVLGYAGDERLQFDFLHPKRAESATKKRLLKAPGVAAVLGLFLAAVGVTVAQMTRSDREALAATEQRIQELKESEAEIGKFLELVEGPQGVREFDAGQHVWVDLLHDVLSCLMSNEEVVLEQVDMNQKEGRLVLKTKTKRRESPLEVIQRLHEFRREGQSRPLFRVTMGPQSEKAKEKYPFSQDLRIEILDDDAGAKAAGRSKPQRD